MLDELEAAAVAPEFESLKARAKAMDDKFKAAIDYVKAAENNEFLDLCSRRLYEMAGNCVMAQLLIRDASANAELFGKSAKVYLNLAEAEVMKHSNFIMNLTADQIADYKKA
ncbi:Acyl-CoA dehydrogenase C-terminal domain-containing protein [Fibrobacter sp. HC4]|uniref:Acyl-CoA dehydrogenase C-terminal domain-containing protein n=1 Tax=Fibrobacter sp. HC4 TaxID=3239812 RepID=UPI0038737B71